MSLENVKKIVGFGLDLGSAILSAVEAPTPLSKAVAMLHLLEDAPILMGVDYAALKAEVAQLSPADLDELNTFIDSKLSLPDASTQEKVELIIGVVIDLAKVAEKAVAMWKPKAAA